MTLYDAMVDPELMGSTFGADSFWAWRTVAKIMDGLPLDESEFEFFKKITGRTIAPTKPFPEGYVIKPRRAGGSLFFAGDGLHSALQDCRDRMGPGETAVVAVIASDKRQARQIMGYVKGLIAASPLIAAEVESMTADSITFKHRSRLEIHTTSFRSTRGYSYKKVITDEMAQYRSDTSANPDVELIRAVRPGLSNLGGRLFGLSSPYARRGHLYAMYQRHFGRDDSDVLVIQGSGRMFNPTLDQRVIDRAYAEDELSARSEWGGQFREDISQFLMDADIDRAIERGAKSRPARIYEGLRYHAFTDMSGGRHDDAVLAVAHQEGERAILDKLVIVPAPFDPEVAVVRMAEALSAYNLRVVTGDNYSGEWIPAAFRKHQIGYIRSELSRSQIYLEAAPLFSGGLVDVLDVPMLETQLRMLERKPRVGNRGEAVDHGPGGRDDVSNAACGALVLAARQQSERQRGESSVTHSAREYDVLADRTAERDREPRWVGAAQRPSLATDGWTFTSPALPEEQGADRALTDYDVLNG